MNSGRRLAATLKTPLGLAAAVSFLMLLLLAIFAPMIFSDAASRSDPTQISQGPTQEHVLGTDAGGRDILLRVLVATRLSVIMALTATFIGVVVGIFLGCLPSVTNRKISRPIISIINIAVAFPALLLAIALSVILGQSAFGAVVAIGLAMVPSFARLTYTLSASTAGKDFISAARILGVGRPALMVRHILPNIRDPLIVNASVSAGVCLVAFAGLSFLGLGVQAPAYDWGRMLSYGVDRIFVNPVSALAPGLAIIISGLIFTLVGEVLSKSLIGGSDHTAAPSGQPSPRPSGVGPPDGGRGAFGERETEATSPSHSVHEPVLSVRDLKVDVPAPGGTVQPVKGISFDVGKGEIVGLVGESGSGKSLSVMSIAGLVEEPIRVTAGRVWFDGVELTDNGVVTVDPGNRKLAKHLATRLAMVFQDPMSSLNPSMKIGAQVAEVGVLHERLSRRRAMQRAIDRLGAVKIGDSARRARQYPHEFSGGMRQRAMIAMGLMGSPSLVIADEPTTALDVTVQREVLGLLHAVKEERDASVLFISHDIAVVTGLCSRVLVMYQGRIVEEISTSDLVAGGAKHPYTRALLASVPSMSTDRRQKLATISEEHGFEGVVEPDASTLGTAKGGARA